MSSVSSEGSGKRRSNILVLLPLIVFAAQLAFIQNSQDRLLPCPLLHFEPLASNIPAPGMYWIALYV